jgi:hypothetical protein
VIDISDAAGVALVAFSKQTHLPENLGDTGFDVIVVELNGHAAKPAKNGDEVIG